ncbi:hypothetical protein Poly24_31130 [Rosistilla carotiformis]|uniref:Uncharacterized protein n=1 Tax=Rosistilla carotiformis TaxID=2528017 RepID=A0A518JV37_9BACT|nr:hypothetical protein Poly24_31130 [Rosistilla carotiformis]
MIGSDNVQVWAGADRDATIGGSNLQTHLVCNCAVVVVNHDAIASVVNSQMQSNCKRYVWLLESPSISHVQNRCETLRWKTLRNFHEPTR